MKKDASYRIIQFLAVLLVGGVAVTIIQLGFGASLRLLGWLVLSVGLLVFLFFLSVDPGYGWVKGENLRTNYLTISASILICLLGLLAIIMGDRLANSQLLAEQSRERCQALTEQETVGALLWQTHYRLLSKTVVDGVQLYLFQHRGYLEKHKLMLVDQTGKRIPYKKIQLQPLQEGQAGKVITLYDRNPCSEVFEQDFGAEFSRPGRKAPVTLQLILRAKKIFLQYTPLPVISAGEVTP